MPKGKRRTVVVESRKAYMFVYSRDWDKLEDKVNEAIAEGYVPIGGISVTAQYLYSQALMDREMVVTLLAEAVAQDAGNLNALVAMAIEDEKVE